MASTGSAAEGTESDRLREWLDSGPKTWKLWSLFALIAAVPLLVAFFALESDSNLRWALLRDAFKDLGVVIFSIVAVDFVWTLIGGEPHAVDIKRMLGMLGQTERRLQQRVDANISALQATETKLIDLNSLSKSAQELGLTGVGHNLTTLGFRLADHIKKSKETIRLCGITMELLRVSPHLVEALAEAAGRGVKVRILLIAPDNPWLAGSNDNIEIVSAGVEATLNVLEDHVGASFEVKVLKEKIMLVSILCCDEVMLVTPYLVSAETNQTPRLLVEGRATPLFQKYAKEFDKLFSIADEPVYGQRPSVGNAAASASSKAGPTSP